MAKVEISVKVTKTVWFYAAMLLSKITGRLVTKPFANKAMVILKFDGGVKTIIYGRDLTNEHVNG